MTDAAFRSLRDNILYPQPTGSTIADGLRTGLSERTFAIIRRHTCIILSGGNVDLDELPW